MSQAYGVKLDPMRSLKSPFGVKGIRQKVIVTNNPSSIREKETLRVSFPNLGPHDVIVPGSVRLTFDIELDSDDANRTIVKNLGRAIVEQIVIKLEGREIQSVRSSDIFFCYCDLWKTREEREDLVYQGIQSDNAAKLRIDAGDKATSNKRDVVISNCFGNRFCIPLDFELLETHTPYHQSALRDRLEYELTFNSHSNVLLSSEEASYRISGICLEFEKVTHPELSRLISEQYSNRLAIYYERVLLHMTQIKNKMDSVWNFHINTPAKSMKGILMIFKERGVPFAQDTEKFFNPQINKVQITVEGQPNQVFSSGMLPIHHFEEIRRLLGGGRLNTQETDRVSKELHLHNVRLDDFLHNKYALWIDLRTCDDTTLHGSGRRIENMSQGVSLELHKPAIKDENIDVYIYVLSDAQLNIQNERLRDVSY